VETLTNPVQSYNGHCQFDADFREWGNPYWTQNTRLMYWTMPAAGDFDLMQPLFKMYLDALPLRKTITRLAFNHDGALFQETMEFWGGAPDSDFGRNNSLPPGQTGHGYMQYYPHGALEILNIMSSYFEFTGDTAFRDATLLPFGKEIIDYYRLHWPLTDDGKIRLTGLTSLEQATDTTNPAPDIAGLITILPKLAACTPDAAQRTLWTNMHAALPPLPRKVSNGQQILTLAELTPARVSGFEKPELYAMFPYRLYGVGRPDLDLGLETWRQRGNQGTGGWQQDAIQAAMLGLANEAKTYITQNYERTSPGFRFQAMWGPNYDWIPDQDHGCVPMSAMQSMLLQPVGDRLILLPAWPNEWNVSFKLHAPQNTTIECEVENGNVTKLIVTPQSRLQDVEISSPFVPMQATLPTAPTGLGATAVSASTIKLSWDDIAVNETGLGASD
jgi:alpha-L-fucosidase 2